MSIVCFRRRWQWHTTMNIYGNKQIPIANPLSEMQNTAFIMNYIYVCVCVWIKKPDWIGTHWLDLYLLFNMSGSCWWSRWQRHIATKIVAIKLIQTYKITHLLQTYNRGTTETRWIGTCWLLTVLIVYTPVICCVSRWQRHTTLKIAAKKPLSTSKVTCLLGTLIWE